MARKHAVGILLTAWCLLQATAALEPVCCAVRDAVLQNILVASARLRCQQDHLRLPHKYDGGTAKCRPEYCRADLPAPPKKIIDCINSVPKPPDPDPEDINIAQDSPVHLRAIATWRSSKTLRHNVTLVTQLSLDRLPQLLAQCRSWSGPISAAVYLVLSPEEVETAVLKMTCVIRHISKFIRFVDADEDLCALDIILVYEHKKQDLAMRGFPVNMLRNIARIQARTELLALIDVDFVVSREFSMSLTNTDTFYALAFIVRTKAVLVIPAFELKAYLDGTNRDTAGAAKRADQLAAANKSQMVKSYQMQELVQFSDFLPGHAPTDYARWTSTNEYYEVEYAEGYEPYVLVHRLYTPWYDARFRGYGMNKIQHLANLNFTGHKFVVHPTAYIVHRAHAPSAAKEQHDRDKVTYEPRHQYYDAHNMSSLVLAHALFDAAKELMLNGTYIPVVDAYTQACLATLSWWSQPAR